MPILKKVIDGVKEEFADAVANGGGIYAVGYCFGGKYVLLLASETPSTATDEEQGTAAEEPLIKAGALAHGTMIDRADFENVKSPVALVCVGKLGYLRLIWRSSWPSSAHSDKIHNRKRPVVSRGGSRSRCN